MKTYYINVARSYARRDWMESQLSELQFDYERIPAIDGACLSEAELKTWIDQRRVFLYSSRIITPRMVGCFISHREAWKKVAAGPDQFAVIMEDDILVSRKGAELLKDDSWIPNQTALIRLDQQVKVYLLRCYKRIEFNGASISLFDFEGGCGNGAYIIHKSMAEWLISNFNKMYQDVDMQMIDVDLFSRNRPPPFSESAPLVHRAQIFPALVAHQFQCKQRFLPVEAELSLIEEDQPSSDVTTLGQKMNRELRRLIDKKSWKRQFITIGYKNRNLINQIKNSIMGRKWEPVPFLE